MSRPRSPHTGDLDAVLRDVIGLVERTSYTAQPRATVPEYEWSQPAEQLLRRSRIPAHGERDEILEIEIGQL